MTTPKHKTIRASQRGLPWMLCGMPADLEDSTGLQVAPYHTGGMFRTESVGGYGLGRAGTGGSPTLRGRRCHQSCTTKQDQPCEW
jgi:hypothetical protein